MKLAPVLFCGALTALAGAVAPLQAQTGTNATLARAGPDEMLRARLRSTATTVSEFAQHAAPTTWAALARFARTHPEAIATAARHRAQFPAEAGREVTLAGDLAAEAVDLALSAADAAWMKRLMGNLPDTADAPVLEAAAILLRAAVDSATGTAATGPVVEVYASGDVRGVLGQSSGGSATTGTGSLGFSFATHTAVYTAMVAVASTQDSVTSNYGATVLTPATGGSLKSALLDVRWRRAPFLHTIHVYAAYASSLWRYTNQKGELTTQNATTVGLGGLWYHNLQDGNIGETPFQVSVEGGVALRFLAGDVGSDAVARDSTLRTTAKTFFGAEIGFQIVFGRVTGSAMFYYLMGPRVAGVTRGQIAIGFSAAADFVRSRLGPKTD
jgi:hypothetical protein